MAAPTEKFSAALEQQLIELVQAREHLWQVTHPEYHKKDVREKGYEEIAEALCAGLTGALVKARWMTLRSQYRREKRKIEESKRSGAGAATVYVPKWYNFSAMEFLQASREEMPSISSLSSPVTHVEDDVEGAPPQLSVHKSGILFSNPEKVHMNTSSSLLNPPELPA